MGGIQNVVFILAVMITIALAAPPRMLRVRHIPVRLVEVRPNTSKKVHLAKAVDPIEITPLALQEKLAAKPAFEHEKEELQSVHRLEGTSMEANSETAEVEQTVQRKPSQERKQAAFTEEKSEPKTKNEFRIVAEDKPEPIVEIEPEAVSEEEIQPQVESESEASEEEESSIPTRNAPRELDIDIVDTSVVARARSSNSQKPTNLHIKVEEFQAGSLENLQGVHDKLNAIIAELAEIRDEIILLRRNISQSREAIADK